MRQVLRGRWAAIIAVFVLANVLVFAPAAGREPTLSEMAGQLIMIGFNGSEPSQPGVRGLIGEAAAGRIGGIILFGGNIKNPAQLMRLTNAFQSASDAPLMIAVDQEGGAVQRLNARSGFVSTPSAADMARRENTAGAERRYARMAQSLAGAGITTNLAPVVDLNVNPSNPVVGKVGRSYGADPAVVARYASAFVDAHRDAGVLTALKHFPGHGSSRGDTHEGFVDVSATWSKRELEPFRRMVQSGDVDMVMVAHVALDTGGDKLMPATLSRDVVEGLLRREVGFDGVAMSDDLEMAAVRRQFPRSEAAVRSLMAGVDLMIFAAHGSDPAKVAREVHWALLRAAEADPAVRARIKEAYMRIARLKANQSRPFQHAAAPAALGPLVPTPRPNPAR